MKRIKLIVKLVLSIVLNVFFHLYVRVLPKIEKNERKYYLTVCAIFKNEARFFKEWIEYHKLIGVEHFFLYNNFSDDNYEEILRPYIELGWVTLIDWPLKQGQVDAYSNCFTQYASSCKWMAFIDLDEYLVPIEDETICDFLKGFEIFPSVHLYWKMFGTSGFLESNNSELVTEKYTSCWPINHDTKSIVNTDFHIDNFREIHTYKCKVNKMVIPGVDENKRFISFNLYNNRGYKKAQINHYWSKSFNEYLMKHGRGDAFFESSPRDLDYFYYHETKNIEKNYIIQRFLIKLKMALNNGR
ncbi:glycosyltransferase family 92 protein [Vibrio alginolyticus]|nr:glycosyltransferase family 92 protein [Vibrio alginolyticus]